MRAFGRFLAKSNDATTTKRTAGIRGSYGCTRHDLELVNARSDGEAGGEIDWQSFDEHFGAYYRGGKGRPAISTRLMVSLHYLKYTHNLSDEAVVRGWVENPYWQYLSGMEFFCHEPPIDRRA